MDKAEGAKTKRTDSGVPLPDALREFADAYPGVWSAYDALAEASREAGPLTDREQRLVKLGIAIGAGREGAVHSHTRRALASGVEEESLIHVGILAITTLGWPGAFAAICWINDILKRKRKRPETTV